ncbi:MAG: hypothetical protein AUK24_03220 [Syntrophaceae bacterium CG2_30_49_12]|nr:MAG: hypothetical protein AUK24_03220 [Syntrophaceae bacterium CG2_30_49_12]PJC72711.1 MAG: hypothetical protein CO012_11500 [Syntrophobacterales bacterium CG_4_8_14_3_um_filter_49_14]
MIDIAVPRDVELEVTEIDNVFLYNIDDLQGVVDENIKSRRQVAAKPEYTKVVNYNLQSYLNYVK